MHSSASIAMFCHDFLVRTANVGPVNTRNIAEYFGVCVASVNRALAADGRFVFSGGKWHIKNWGAR